LLVLLTCGMETGFARMRMAGSKER